MTLRISLAQINLLVGDVPGNASRVIDAACRARDEQQADAVVFPELTLTGYPPEDLLLRPELVQRVEHELARICDAVKDIDVVLGYPRASQDELYNAAGIIRNGKIFAEYHKQCLPNYSVLTKSVTSSRGTNPVCSKSMAFLLP